MTNDYNSGISITEGKKPIYRRNRIGNILSHFSVFLLIVITHGSLIYAPYAKMWLIIFILVAFYVRLKSKNNSLWNYSLIYLYIVLYLMIQTSLFHNTYDEEFKIFVLFAILSYLVINSFSLLRFKKIFLNVVFCISIYSVILFAISFFVHLPLHYDVGENTIMGIWGFHAIEWNGVHLSRNTGIFTEPGCFQYCLNYTLLLYLEDIIKKRLDNATKFKLIVVVITLITCASTTGYLVFMFLLTIVLYYIYKGKILKQFFISLPIFVILTSQLYYSEVVNKKFDKDNNSYIMRTADAMATIKLIQDNPFVGNGGVSTIEYQRKVQQYGSLTSNTGATNGVLVGMAVLGVSWLLAYCYFCNKACKRIYKIIPTWMIVCLTLLIHTNEFYIFSPIVYIFIFPFKRTSSPIIS